MAKPQSIGARVTALLAPRHKRGANGAAGAEWIATQLRTLFLSRAGKPVTIETALQVSAVLACVRVIAEDVAKAPLVVRQRENRAAPWRTIEDHWLARLMRAPNEWQTDFEFRTMLTAHAALAHGGFAFINRAMNGKVVELLPYPPQAVRVKRDGWAIQYEISLPSGQTQIVPAANMFHLRGLSWDGVAGLEAFRLAREAIGISIASEETHAKLHENGVRLSGILSQAPGAAPLSEEAAKRISAEWRENFGPASEHAFGVAVLEGGMKFEPMAMTGVDAQHVETRRFEIEEICRYFRVNPAKIGHFEKAATFGSNEQNAIQHVEDTVLPWAIRWTQRVDRDLLSRETEPHTWVYFDVRGLSRGDARTRASYLNSGIHAGWLSRNEAREMEGLERGPSDLDEYLTPTQLAPGDSADATNARNTPSDEGRADA